MIEAIKKIFGVSPSPDFAQLTGKGAIILDVRTKGEYTGGHIEGSVNISVDQLKDNLRRLPAKETPIITCCASGVRSAKAKGILESNGYLQVFDGGSWASLKHKL